jgi:hypothetical protein
LRQALHLSDDRTTLSLFFEPQESYFLVFKPIHSGEASASAPDGKDFPEWTPVTDVSGPWQVLFDPEDAGPGEVVFNDLQDWTSRSEEGIRYYSGTATYSKTFEIPSDLISPSSSLALDLGRVEVMASVTLNGQDLGIAWKPPFRLEITHAVRPGPNDLTVRVVNLWPNRMIGDELLPEDSERRPDGTLKNWPPWLLRGEPSPTGRTTFSAWRHWARGSELQPSGLLGPVRVLQDK